MEHPDPNDWPWRPPEISSSDMAQPESPAPCSARSHPDNFEFHRAHDAAGFRLLKIVMFTAAAVANVWAVFIAATVVFSALNRAFAPAFAIAAFAAYWSAWYYWAEFKLWDGFSNRVDLIHQAVRTPARVFVWAVGFSVVAFPLVAVTTDGTITGHVLPAAAGAVAGTVMLASFRVVYYERFIANLPVGPNLRRQERLERLAHLEALNRRRPVRR